jgi:hypothetical protein
MYTSRRRQFALIPGAKNMQSSHGTSTTFPEFAPVADDAVPAATTLPTRMTVQQAIRKVELARLELATSWVRSRRSPN